MDQLNQIAENMTPIDFPTTPCDQEYVDPVTGAVEGSCSCQGTEEISAKIKIFKKQNFLFEINFKFLSIRLIFSSQIVKHLVLPYRVIHKNQKGQQLGKWTRGLLLDFVSLVS